MPIRRPGSPSPRPGWGRRSNGATSGCGACHCSASGWWWARSFCPTWPTSAEPCGPSLSSVSARCWSASVTPIVACGRWSRNNLLRFFAARSAKKRRTLEKCFRPDRKVARSLARGIEDSIGHGGVHADDADLADALDPQRIHALILLGHHDDFDGWYVGIHRHHVVGEIVVNDASRNRINLGAFVQGGRQAPNHP